MSTSTVNRREALRRLALGSAGVATLPSWVESLSALAFDQAHQTHKPATTTASARTAWKPSVFTPHQNATVITLTELIIPQTDTPGAKAARVNEFIDGVLSKAQPAEREKFLAGLAWIDARATRDFSAPFVKTTPDQQVALLTPLSDQADARNAAARTAAAPANQADAAKQPGERAPAEGEPLGADFFTALKSMTIVGYYTSDVGVREELGDDGMLFFAEFKGCTHPEHQKA